MLDILYEDRDVAVLNKPAGIAVHPSAHHPQAHTLVAELLRRWPQIQDVGDDPAVRPGIVHRLDKDTSGVLVVAKHPRAFAHLKGEFQSHRVGKTYIALVLGRMPAKEGTIAKPIGRSRAFGKLTTRSPRGTVREAITRWRKLKEYRDARGTIFTLLEVKPETGRTHQIRVHLAAIGHPVIGDALYGGSSAKAYRQALGRQFLHASAIAFELPSGGRLSVEAELPAELRDFLAGLTFGT